MLCALSSRRPGDWTTYRGEKGKDVVEAERNPLVKSNAETPSIDDDYTRKQARRSRQHPLPFPGIGGIGVWFGLVEGVFGVRKVKRILGLQDAVVDDFIIRRYWRVTEQCRLRHSLEVEVRGEVDDKFSREANSVMTDRIEPVG